MLASPRHNQACSIEGHDAIEMTTEGNKEATSFVVLHSIYHHTCSNIRKSFDTPQSHHKLSFETQGTRAQQLHLSIRRSEDRGGNPESVHELLDNHGIFLNDKHHAQWHLHTTVVHRPYCFRWEVLLLRSFEMSEDYNKHTFHQVGSRSDFNDPAIPNRTEDTSAPLLPRLTCLSLFH